MNEPKRFHKRPANTIHIPVSLKYETISTVFYLLSLLFSQK